MTTASFLLGSILLWLGIFGLPWPLLILLLAATTVLQLRYVVGNALIRRRIFFETYLAPESFIQQYKKIGTGAKLFWLVFALALSLVTVISVFSYGSANTIAAIAGIALGFILASAGRKLWLRHAHPTFQSYLDSKAVTGIAVITGAIALFRWEVIASRSDHANLSSTHAADTVIAKTHHPVKWVQHFARTNQYASLTMLRMRDNPGNAAGNLIYAYLIIPNLLPLYGMVTTIKGGMFILSTNHRES